MVAGHGEKTGKRGKKEAFVPVVCWTPGMCYLLASQKNIYFSPYCQPRRLKIVEREKVLETDLGSNSALDTSCCGAVGKFIKFFSFLSSYLPKQITLANSGHYNDG